MATYLEKAAPSFNHLFSFYYVFFVLVTFHFGFDDRIFALIVPVPGGCLLFTYLCRLILKYSHFMAQSTLFDILRNARDF